MTATLFLALALATDPLGGPDAPSSGVIPPAVAELAFVQKPGSQVPLDATFRDEQGKTLRLGDVFGRKPVILVMAWYRCPQLCTLVLNGLLTGLKGVPYRPGSEFEIVVVSFDPRETPELAAAKKAHYLENYGRPGADAGWHFLTGDKDQIDRLSEAVGFHYAYDAKHDRYDHPSGVMVLTSGGQVSRYLFGIRFLPRDLKLGIIEASEGKVGTVVDSMMLFCFHYDADTGAYALTIKNVVRAGGVITVIAIAVLLFRLRRSEKLKARIQQA